jgi:hypothetical protein
VLTLKKITTRYCQAEDRICISALASNGTVIGLWASQRILIRLIPRICEWLEEEKTFTLQADIKSKKLMNDFAQHEARIEMKPETPVYIKSTDQKNSSVNINASLIHEIEITYSTELMELKFKDAQNHIFKLLLTKLYARQWLIILNSQWAKAEWQVNVWPEWLTQSSLQSLSDAH